ncbi:hypothetical protein [Catellatospora sp. NPDC049609]|uniref:hypothetical protein n=1 Tax=Catellatospora sp. NPDC049609 TaxID=3155505 RepID=UPI003432845F
MDGTLTISPDDTFDPAEGTYDLTAVGELPAALTIRVRRETPSTIDEIVFAYGPGAQIPPLPDLAVLAMDLFGRVRGTAAVSPHSPDRPEPQPGTYTAIATAARVRDGDECRFCGALVDWVWNPRSARSGRIAPLDPAKAVDGVDVVVVSCAECARAYAAAPGSLTPAPRPLAPHYGAATVQYLTRHGIEVTPSPARDTPPSPSSEPGQSL